MSDTDSAARTGPAKPTGLVSRAASGLLGLGAFALAVYWAPLGVAYTDPDINTRAVPYTELLVMQAVVATIGISACGVGGITGLRHLRTGQRRLLRWHLGALAIVSVLASIWVVLAFAIGSA